MLTENFTSYTITFYLYVQTLSQYLIRCDDILYKLSINENNNFLEDMEPLSKFKEYIVIRQKKSDDLGCFHGYLLLIQMRYLPVQTSSRKKSVCPF